MDFTRAQATYHSLSRLKSQYRHSCLPNNRPAAAVAYGAVAANVDADIALELDALFKEV